MFVFVGIVCGRDIVLVERVEKFLEKVVVLKDDDEVFVDVNNDDKEVILFMMLIEVKLLWLKKLFYFVYKSIIAFTEVVGRYEKALKFFFEVV